MMATDWNYPRVRVEVEADGLTNRVQNHSGQDGNTNGWAVTPPASLSAVDLAPYGSLGDGFVGWALSWYAEPGGILSGPAVAAAGTSVAFQVTVRDARGDGVRGGPLEVEAWVQWYDDAGVEILPSSRPYLDSVTIDGDRPHVITLASTQYAVSVQYAPQAAVTARPCIAVTTPDGTTAGMLVGCLMVVQTVGHAGATGDSGIADIAWSAAEAWQNMAGSAVTVDIDRGVRRDGIRDRLEPGRANVTILDSALDPQRSPRLRKGRRFRITADNGGTQRALFTGIIDAVRATYPRDKSKGKALRPRVTITGDDRVGELGNTLQPANYNGDYTAKVRALMAPSTLPFRAPVGTASTTAVSFDANANLADQLQRATNSYPAARCWMAADGYLDFAEIDGPDPVAILTDLDLPTLRNYCINPSYEGSGNLGGAIDGDTHTPIPGTTVARSTSWASDGTYSLRVTADGSPAARVYQPATEDSEPGVVLSQWIDPDTLEPVDGSGWFAARVTVKALQACHVILVAKHKGQPVSGWAGVDMAAGDTYTLTGSDHLDLGQSMQYSVSVQPYGYAADAANLFAANSLTGDLIEVDQWNIYGTGDQEGIGTEVQWIPSATYTDPDTGVVTTEPGVWVAFLPWYWDGDTGGSWEGTPYASPSRWAPSASYTQIEPVFGLDGMTNTVTIDRHLAAEPEGHRTYGPYVAVDSAAEWGPAVDNLDIVDTDPWALAQTVLRRNSIPSAWPDTLTVDADQLGDARAALVFAEPYDSVVVMLSDSSIARPAFLLAVQHSITADHWLITYTLRPVDTDPADTVVNIDYPTGGPQTGPVDTVPAHERYDSGWIDLPPTAAGFAQYANGPAQYRKTGNEVRMQGGYEMDASVPDGFPLTVLANIPAGFRPEPLLYFDFNAGNDPTGLFGYVSGGSGNLAAGGAAGHGRFVMFNQIRWTLKGK